jgi:nucleoside-diphosphate-sugar epimerase
MKALVTGGTGFVGRYVVDALLAEGHRVSVFSRRGELPDALRDAGAECVQGDLRDFPSVEGALAGMEAVFHVGEIKPVTSPSAAKMNVELVSFMAERMRGEGVRRFVFVSTISAAGVPSETPADEDTEPALLMHDNYTEYKRKCEGLLAEGAKEFEHVILRPAPVVGAGSRYLDAFLRVMEKLAPLGIPFPGGGKSLAPFVQVRDLARAITLAGVREEAAGMVFHLTDGMRHTWHDFFRITAGALGKKLRMIPLPGGLISPPARLLGILPGLFGLELDPGGYVEFFTRDLHFTNARAERLLGWRPDYTLEEGVKEMVSSFGKK